MFGTLEWWRQQSLARQFLLAGGVVSLLAALVVGAFVTTLIEAAVTRNSAATTAMYVDSIIAPLLPDLQTTEVLDDITSRALDETFGQGALGGRVLSFRLWRSDGTVLYATDPDIIGERFDPSEKLQRAFSGKLVAQFEHPEDEESHAERAAGIPLLEIYNPILQPWSGEVVAVLEFYEVAEDFQNSLSEARLLSWLAVAAVIAVFFLSLTAIVFRGSRTIDDQKATLTQRVAELSDLLEQNRELHMRAQRASQRAAALNESYLRRLGADLHDGPAQLVAYAALRVDSRALVAEGTPEAVRASELAAIKARLDEAMEEIRGICRGMILPDIEDAELHEVIARAVKAHTQRTGSPVALRLSDVAGELSPSVKISIYRFVQEALNNGFRHGNGISQKVRQAWEGDEIVIEVEDEGPGFDPSMVKPGGLGLAGLRERIESIGGRLSVKSSQKGTIVRMMVRANGLEFAQ
ncbi:signal transduction histidine kinase [Pseudorhizobium tarimense]|uniref:Signal transduction histidine kinase n=1 Tax=Pseudorhizobium tarimense TaxID=1079109 RepID=A0ABV2HDC3_9HYPH|nr:sensor histidine kinase [Pseudorhizobium tarimense]MCJ8521527.1 sensor histidine kinase [Pseudorhizobium tarimense]